MGSNTTLVKAPEDVVIGHNRLIAAVTAGVAAVLALAWFGRAVSGGSVGDWVAVLVLGLIAGVEFATLRDAQVPLLVADGQGIRIRRGDSWHGLLWADVREVQVHPRAGLLGDGRLEFVATDGESTYAVPLSITTRANTAHLADALSDLSAGRTVIARVARPVEAEVVETVDAQPVPMPGPVEPVREVTPVKRYDVTHRSEPVVRVPVEEAPAMATVVAEPILIDDEAALTPGILGPMLLRARTESGLSLDRLSERTRIRAHVLERMEADDFGPCGGDFYARGHLTTVARPLGLDAQRLLATYDEHYAHAPIAVQQVFEAELGSSLSSGVRSAFAGPRWSLFVGACLAIGGIWAGVQMLDDQPREVLSPAPNVVDSVGLSSSQQEATKPQSSMATMTIRAVGVGSDVVVRDKDGRIIWADHLKAGQSHRVFGFAPFNVAASKAPAVHLTLLGKDIGVVAKAPGGADRTINLPASE